MVSDYYDYPGVIHLHSTHSDGIKDVAAIIKAAQKANCRYLILTDHDTLKALPQEGWYNHTALLVGEEVTVGEDQGHYLGLRLDSAVRPRQSPQATINTVTEQGGIGFISHPFDRTWAAHFNFRLTPVTWKDWDVTGFTGIEIWNYSWDWAEGFDGLLKALWGLLHPDGAIDGPPAEALQKWDELLRRRRVTGIAGVDAHGYFYSYRRMFKTLRTHVLLNKPLSFQPSFFERDKNLICDALGKGNCYLSYDSLKDGSGFMFTADNGRQRGIMGDEVRLGEGVTLQLSSPHPALLRIVKDGEVIAGAENSRSLAKTVDQPGAYRAEAFLSAKGPGGIYRPWIYSNPVYVSEG